MRHEEKQINLTTVVGNCFLGSKARVVVACRGCPGGDCGTCNIMDYAEIFHLPVVLFFKKRVLKGEVRGFTRITKENLKDCTDAIEERDKRENLWSGLNTPIFYVMNLATFWSFSAALHDLWHAQGGDVVIRRSTKFPRESWRRWFEFKKGEWSATGIMAALMISAAATLIHITDHTVPQLLCLASIICNLGCALASTTLLCCFGNVNSARLVWYQRGAWFILALSAPSGWLRWGIVTLLGALLAVLWMSQPIAADVLGTIFVTAQLILFFHHSFIFRDVELFTNGLPFTPGGIVGDGRVGTEPVANTDDEERCIKVH